MTHDVEILCKQRYLALRTGDLFDKIAQLTMITAWSVRSQRHREPDSRSVFYLSFRDRQAAKRFMRKSIDNTAEMRLYPKNELDITADQFVVLVNISDTSRSYVTRDNLLETTLLQALCESGRPGSVEDPDMVRYLNGTPLAASGKCAGCHCSPDVLKTCSACRLVGYCSKTCQKEHWVVHRLTCRPAPNNHLRGR